MCVSNWRRATPIEKELVLRLYGTEERMMNQTAIFPRVQVFQVYIFSGADCEIITTNPVFSSDKRPHTENITRKTFHSGMLLKIIDTTSIEREKIRRPMYGTRNQENRPTWLQ